MADSFTSPEASPLRVGAVTEVPGVLHAPDRPVSLGFQLFLGLANTIAWLTVFPIVQILLPAQVAALDPRNKVVSLGVVATIGALAAVLGNPIAGALSDRTSSRFGRRRPWMLGGMLISAVALLCMAQVPSIVLLAIAWAVSQFFGNALLAALAAIIPDRVPERQRGTISAIVSLSIPLSIIIGAILTTVLLSASNGSFTLPYTVLVGIFVVIVGLYTLTYREERLPVEAVPSINIRQFLASFWIDPRRYPDFGYAFITRFLVVLGYTMGTGYLNFYLRDIIHYTTLFPGQKVEQGVATLQIIAALCVVVSAMIFGILSDRFQRRKIFVIGSSIVIAIGLLLLGLVHSWNVAIIANALIGVGFGAYLGIDIALVTQVLPHPENRGKDLGIINVANAFPQFIAPALGAFAISIFTLNVGVGYTVLFISASVLVLLGAVLVQPIKGVR